MQNLDDSRLLDLKSRVKQKLSETTLFKFKGTVSKLLGLTVEVKLPGLKIGDLCYIETDSGKRNRRRLLPSRVKPLNFCYFWTETVLVRKFGYVNGKADYYSGGRFPSRASD